VHDEFDYKQDHDIYEHVNIHYDEDMSIKKYSFGIQIKFFYLYTLDDVNISIVDFSKIVRDAES